MIKKFFVVIKGTDENSKLDEIDFVDATDNGETLFFDSQKSMIDFFEEDSSISGCRVFILEVSKTGIIKSTPKFSLDK